MCQRCAGRAEEKFSVLKVEVKITNLGRPGRELFALEPYQRSTMQYCLVLLGIPLQIYWIRVTCTTGKTPQGGWTVFCYRKFSNIYKLAHEHLGAFCPRCQIRCEEYKYRSVVTRGRLLGDSVVGLSSRRLVGPLSDFFRPAPCDGRWLMKKLKANQ